MTDEPNTKNDDRLAGGGDFDVIAFLDRELAATGAQSYDSTAEGLMRTKGYIAALRQRCEGWKKECDELQASLRYSRECAAACDADLRQAERERDDTLNAFAAAVRGIGGSVHLTPLAMRDLSRQKWRIVRTDDADGGMTLRVAAIAHDAQEKK